MKNLFSWKSLRKLGVAGLGIVGVMALTSGIGVLPFVSTAVAIGLSAATTALALVGVGVVGLAAGLAVVKGAFNVLKFAFSKKYRNQLKEKRQERKQQREQRRANRKNKNKNKANEDVVEVKDPVVKNEEDLNDQLEEKPKKKKAARKTKTDTLENPKVEDPKVEDPKVLTAAKTLKAGGYYDKMTDDNKAIYDEIIKKNAKSLFEGLDRSQVQQMKALTGEHVKVFKAKIKKGETLTEQEQMELARASALYTKASNRLKKMDQIDSERTTLTEDQINVVYNKVAPKKNSSGR